MKVGAHVIADSKYANQAAIHRGRFLEKSTAHLFRKVFGKQYVLENVIVRKGQKDIDGEADVLVNYGQFVIVAQAKSKRITLRARSGDAEALASDFKGAIQDPFQQAQRCAELIKDGSKCYTSQGKEITISPTAHFFPAVILSDQFPSSTILSSFLLRRESNLAPVIWDLAFLDCVTQVLPSPVELMFYLKSRSETFDTIHSDSEYNFLGYHLSQKLVLPSETDWLMIDRDFAGKIDDFMIAKDMGLIPERPIGILERIEIPVISRLFRDLKSAPAGLAEVVIDLYEFSSDALEDLARNVLAIRDEVKGGKAFKALSLRTTNGGLTYFVCKTFDQRARKAAELIGQKHKYDSKRDRWYVLVDRIDTPSSVDALLPILGKWKESPDAAKASKEIGELFGSKPGELGRENLEQDNDV